MVSSAGVERNAKIGDDEERRKADIPIVQLNPGGVLNHKSVASAGLWVALGQAGRGGVWREGGSEGGARVKKASKAALQERWHQCGGMLGGSEGHEAEAKAFHLRPSAGRQ